MSGILPIIACGYNAAEAQQLLTLHRYAQIGRAGRHEQWAQTDMKVKNAAEIVPLDTQPAASLDTCSAIESMLSYSFNNPGLLYQALEVPMKKVCDGNFRLAHLGDGVITLVLRDAWFPKADFSRRYMHESLNRLACNSHLAKEARRIGLHRYFEGTDIASTAEALIGAVWLDCGKDLDIISEVILGLLTVHQPFLESQ